MSTSLSPNVNISIPRFRPKLQSAAKSAFWAGSVLLLLTLLIAPAESAVFTEWNLQPGSLEPYSLVADNNGWMWFTEYGSDRIGVLTFPVNPTNIQEFSLPLGSRPSGIAFEYASLKRIWFADSASAKIGVITGSAGGYYLTEYAFTQGSGPTDVAVQTVRSDEPRIWFTEFNNHAIGALLLNATALAPNRTEWYLPDSACKPLSIIYLNTTGVWFTEFVGDRIGNFNLASGQLREWPLPAGSYPTGIANDTYGNIWFTETGRNRIGRLNPYTNEITEYIIPTANSQPYDIVVDSRNNIWFTERGANKIGKFIPGIDMFVEFERRVGGAPYGITIGAAGTSEFNKVWFTDRAGNRIGRLDPTVGMTTATVSTIQTATGISSTVTTVGSSVPTSTTRVTTSGNTTSYVGYGAVATTISTTSYTLSETSNILRTSSAIVSTSYLTVSGTSTYTSTSYMTTELKTTSVTSTSVSTATRTYSVTVTVTSTSYIATVSTTQIVTWTLTSTVTVVSYLESPTTAGFAAGPNRAGSQAWTAILAVGVVTATSTGGVAHLLARRIRSERCRLRWRRTAKKAGYVVGIALLISVLAAPYAKGAAITEWSLPAGSMNPYGVTTDDRNPYYVWFTEFAGSDKIGRLLPGTGEIAEITLPPGSRPWGIAFETARHEVWFTESGRNRIGRITNYGDAVDEFVLTPSNPEGPRGIAIQEMVNGTDKPYIWFTMYGASRIGRLDPYHHQNITQWYLTANAGPQAIIYVPDTGVWFTETLLSPPAVGNLDPSTGTIKEWTLPPGSNPWDLTYDSYRNVWITDPGRNMLIRLNPYSGEITEYRVPAPGSSPYGIGRGSGNMIWFAEHGQNRIARYSPDDNTFVEFARTTGGAPYDITLGPDGKIWFTDDAGNKIGKLDPMLALTTVTVTSISTASTTTRWATPASTIFSPATTKITTTLTEPTTTRSTAYTSKTSYDASETIRVLQTSTTSTVTVYSNETIVVLGTRTSWSSLTVSTTTQTTTSPTTFTHAVTVVVPGTFTSSSYTTTTTTTSSTVTWRTTKALPCIIASAAYGSDLSPEIQFLRYFRDRLVLSTFAGGSFMNVFNNWYYSFSPSVASVVAVEPWLAAAVRALIIPLLGILHLASITYAALSFIPEVAIVVAGLVASALIGAVYGSPFVAAILVSLRRRRGLALRLGNLKILLIPWVATMALMVIAEMTRSTVLMMTMTATLVLTTVGTSAVSVAILILNPGRLRLMVLSVLARLSRTSMLLRRTVS